MNYELNHKTIFKSSMLLSFFFCLFSSISFSQQLASSIDSTKIKIGEQITYRIEIETDTTDLVVFPEGQTFSPLEMIESYKIDTTKKDAKFKLIKKYGLTQFDSGNYTIPRQKILIGDKTFFTDSLKVFVNNIAIDTTKQGLYDIKPIISVEKSASNWWKTLLIILAVVSIVGGLIYWFVWRKKPLTKEEEIALLPPYERAKLALKHLDESHYLEHSELKEYYSELTFIIRKYLDEKVYDRALESTTDELIYRLNLLKDGNQIDISKEDIKNLESILKRADLVKFAKSAPDIELAKLDRNTIDLEIDNVKEALPEPTEEEKLLNQQYKEAQARKKKRRKKLITGVAILGLLIAIFIGFGLKYGFTYVKDTLIGHDSKELLEGDWVRSEYGVPPIEISTPKVLKRNNPSAPKDISSQIQTTAFNYGTIQDELYISLSTTTFPKQAEGEEKEKIDPIVIAEESISKLEKEGIVDIFVKQEKFATPNGAEGLKTFGTLKVPVLNSDKYHERHYVLLQFISDSSEVLQQIMITWDMDDTYTNRISERIISSIELKKAAQ
ncbi:hypothetical protein DI383_03750 [Flavobacteriaceae bacterium LYZ1037]|nr:hypothetical protein DI383_03750 [Flavobacteriaceae bacterium LYZ1037]